MENEMTAEERQSLYFMKSALIGHYKRKYPENEAFITEICEMVGRLLGAQEPQGAGGVGMIQGWEESIREIEANH